MGKKNKKKGDDFKNSLLENNVDSFDRSSNEQKVKLSKEESNEIELLQSKEKSDKQSKLTKNIDLKAKQPRAPPSKSIKKGKMSVLDIKKMMEDNKKKKEEEERNAKILEEEKKKRLKEREEMLKLQMEKKVEKERLEMAEIEKKQKEDMLQRNLIRMNISKNTRKLVDNEKVKVDEHKISNRHKSPICCILGHVDTGKTKLLDKLRESNVQEREAGGITQQIGATFFPSVELTKKCGKSISSLPGILIIDTPGHEAFSNLRSRGSSICNLAILVVDIVHGLEPQTIESINLLKSKKTPFIVALNKIDRIYGWKSYNYGHWEETFESQNEGTREEFETRLKYIIKSFAELGYNASLFDKNPDDKRYVSLVPTSAISGEGIPDLVSLILTLSEKYMKSRMEIKDEVECTILEVKNTEGFGMTLDVILSNGEINVGDKIGFSGTDGPIITTIRTLLVPQPLKELRIKGVYEQIKRARASLGIKIFAHDTEKAIAGSRVYVVQNNDEEIRNRLNKDYESILSSIDLSEEGVHVVANTLGSLEALLGFLKQSEIKVANVSVGSLKKKDILIVSAMLEKNREYGVVLNFDTFIDRDTRDTAEQNNVKILDAKIIYHLLDQYIKYVEEVKNKEKEFHFREAIYPVKMSIVPNCIFTKRSPLILGVNIEAGTLKINTPVCTFKDNENISLGIVTSIENNKKGVPKAFKNQKVAIKIETKAGDSGKMINRHFTEDSVLYSVINRKSIDVLKQYFKDELDDEHIELILYLKNKFGII